MSLSYKNQSTDLERKSIDWFLYERDIDRSKVNPFQLTIFAKKNLIYFDSALNTSVLHLFLNWSSKIKENALAKPFSNFHFASCKFRRIFEFFEMASYALYLIFISNLPKCETKATTTIT